VVSRDTPPYGLGVLPGRSLLTKARDKLLNFFIHSVLSSDINKYANKLRESLGLKPYQKSVSREYYENNSLRLILQLSTPAFEYPRSDLPDVLHFIGPVLSKSNPDYQLPQWWSDLNTSTPVVLVNQGTVANDLSDLVIPAIEGLKGQEMIVLAVPVQDGDLKQIPDNVRAEEFIPFGNLLPHVDVMITNGGYGATQMALAHGIPLVIAGATEDKMEVAARVEWSECGINLRRKHPSPQSILNAVREVLENRTFAENAKSLQAEIFKYDAPTLAVELLERLAEDQQRT
jgi:UDP:flavonoid glycosyltransferase YjiC (YdhE family)